MKFDVITESMNALLKQCGHRQERVALAAQEQFAKALVTPLRQGNFAGDIITGIFEEVRYAPGVSIEYPLDFIAPGTEKDYVAYSIPSQGRIPERNVESDYVMVATYDVGNSIDWLLKYARDARWDIVARAMQTLESGFVKKKNDDGAHLLLTSAVDRNIVCFDGDAAQGQFTKRLVSVMKTVMRRNGGGNSSSIRRGKLTDLWISPEANEGMRTWGVDQIDEVTRREIYTAADGTLNRIFNVMLHDIDELGEGQEYQLYFSNELGGSLASGDVELVLGLDLQENNSFVMPVREDIQVFEDPNMHRQRRQGVYAWREYGFASLDNRRCILGSL